MLRTRKIMLFHNQQLFGQTSKVKNSNLQQTWKSRQNNRHFFGERGGSWDKSSNMVAQIINVGPYLHPSEEKYRNKISILPIRWNPYLSLNLLRSPFLALTKSCKPRRKVVGAWHYITRQGSCIYIYCVNEKE